MSKTRKWHVRAIHLAVALAMTLGLLMVPAAVAAPDSEPAASPGPDVTCATLGTCTGGTAVWAAGETHIGVYTPKLSKDGTGAAYGSTYVEFVPNTGTTLADLGAADGTPEWSWWHKTSAVLGNHSQMELRFTQPGGDPDIVLDVTAMPLQNHLGTNLWAEQPLVQATPGLLYYGTDAAGNGYSWTTGGDSTLKTVSGIVAAIKANATCTDTDAVLDALVLTRVRIELWETVPLRTSYVDDVTIKGVNYDLEPCYIIIPETVAKDVKGAEQKFVVLNLEGGMSLEQFEAYDNPAEAMEAAQQECATVTGADECVAGVSPSQVVSWEVIPGLEKSSVGNPGSGADIIVTAGGGPTYPLLGVNNPKQNWIRIWTRDPGDCNVVAWLDEDVRLISEKKWGDIDHTILDLDTSTPIVVDGDYMPVSGQELDISYKAGGPAPGDEEYELIDDWVVAWFYKSPVPSTFLDWAGHAVVHWWLIGDDEAGVNEAVIDAIMADLGPDGCGTYADWPLVPGGASTPFDAIQEVYDPVGDGSNLSEAEFTTFFDVVEGILAPDPNVDGTFNNTGDTYIKTMTENDLPGETRGLVEVELENIGRENFLIVTLTEYPWPYAGENPVCVEKGRKGAPPPPPPIEKLPNIVWAGEKDVIEYRVDPAYEDYLVAFYLEDPSVGSFEATGITGPPAIPSPGFAVQDTAWAVVELGGCDGSDYGVARVVLASNPQGKAHVQASLLSYTWDGAFWEEVEGGIIDNQGFMIYFLAFEDVELANMGKDLTNDEAWLNAGAVKSGLDVNKSSNLRLRVRGWFLDPDLGNRSLREARDVDTDGDGENDRTLPAGRYILPDDYPLLADGAAWKLRKPHWDLMDTPIDNIVSELDVTGGKVETLGSYWDMTKHVADPTEDCYTDLVAHWDVIGPFSKLEPPTETSWDVDLQPAVIADGKEIDEFDIFASCRTTVVPDGKLTPEDANMPPAEVIFAVTDGKGVLAQVNKAGIYQRDETCPLDATTIDGVVYTNPYYWQEIPANPMIPSTRYEWDSWDADPEIDGPYRFWDELRVWPGDAGAVITTFGLDPKKTPEFLKAYTDNHGEGWVKFTQKAFDTSTIKAVAMYPDKTTDYPSVVSNPVEKVSKDSKSIQAYVDDYVDPITGEVDPIRKVVYLFVRDYDGEPAKCEYVGWIRETHGLIESLIPNTWALCLLPCYPEEFRDSLEDMGGGFITHDGATAGNFTRLALASEIAEFDGVTEGVVSLYPSGAAVEPIDLDYTDVKGYAVTGIVVLSSYLEDVNLSIKVYDCWDGEVKMIPLDLMVEFTENNPAVEVGLVSIMEPVNYLVMVYNYKAGEGVEGWTMFNPAWAATHPDWNTLTTLYKNRGYWLNVNAGCTLTYETQSYELDEGWNNIGWGGA